MRDKLSFLQKAGSVEILVSLLEHKGKMYFTELQDKIGRGSISTLNTRILELKNQGLLEDEQEEKFGGRRYFWLTEKGKKVAEHLKDIDDLL
jgi:DNA-binding HxlR family transcriptional regulator